MSDAPGGQPYRMTVLASIDRRRAEAVALQLRRRLQSLGIGGARVAIAPAPAGLVARPGRSADGAGTSA